MLLAVIVAPSARLVLEVTPVPDKATVSGGFSPTVQLNDGTLVTATSEVVSRFASSTIVTTAAASAIHASQRSAGKSAPSQSGGADGGTVRPESPPKMLL